MRNNQKVFWVSILLLIGGMICGCGTTKRIESGEVPTNPMPNEKAAVPKPSSSYVVARHDCLWDIAKNPSIYDDAFQWPLLFKANRDEIQDPDLIYPGQNLKVERDFGSEVISRARQIAMATPKYVPHTKPRTTLPVDYF